MYVYLMEFENRPGLFKIGKATRPEVRASHLSICHGNLTKMEKYNIGENCISVEKQIHRSLHDFRCKTLSKCDGYTEFFTLDCKENAKTILNSFILNPDSALSRKKKSVQPPEGHQRLTINLPEKLHKKLRQAAIDMDCNATDIIVRLLNTELYLPEIVDTLSTSYPSLHSITHNPLA